MNNLLPIVNKLQDIFSTIGAESLELPQIVVVGTQSSGKSSVIEGIVGKDFLPRGVGMMTRRPLILQMVSTKLKSKEIEESSDKPEMIEITHLTTYAKFLHQPNKIYTDFNEIHNEIINETQRVLGDDKDVSSEPIRLRIFSPDSVNLTLIDLPGLTKIPVGKQAVDIEDKIIKITKNFISNKNSIILAVTPANIDIATSEALKIASLVDPKGERTVLCLTKLDLMDKGTNAFDLLSGKVINVKLGIIGVVNRSQFDIEIKKPINKALEDEEKFFLQHYPLLYQWAGVKYLVNVLSKVLLNHIHKCLPELRDRVQSLLIKFKALSSNFGEPLVEKKFCLLNFLTTFVTIYSQIVSGTYSSMTTKELCGGSRIYYIYHEVFGKKINSMDPLDGISKNDVLTAIRNAKGMRTSLFVPEMAFELLVKKQIEKLEAPSLECVTMVHEEMIRITGQAAEQIPQFTRFPVLKDKVFEIVKHVVSQQNEPTFLMIQNMIESELSYINTNHPNFIDTAKEVSEELHEKDLSALPFLQKRFSDIAETGDANEVDIAPIGNSINIQGDMNEKRLQSHSNLLHILIKSYIKIISHKFQDSVPKVISCFLVKKVVERLQSELVDKLFKEQLIEELLVESPMIISQRENNIKMIEALTKANSLISEVKDSRL